MHTRTSTGNTLDGPGGAGGGGLSRTSSFATRSTVDMGGVKPRLSLPTKLGRDRSPGLQWHREYTPATCKGPRCLMVDYVRKEAGGRTRKVIAEEIQDMAALKGVYSRQGGRNEETDLRLFHVQNWPQAAQFMIRKFRLDDDEALTGQPGLAEWILQKKPRRRAGKPLLAAKAWKVSSDPWRRVTKCAAGLDIMKRYPCGDLDNPQMETEKPTCVTGLMGFDAEDQPVLHSNVFAQRTAIYVQYSHTILQTPGPELVSPYGPNIPERFDNGNTIIIFDNSDSHSIYDTLIAARGEWESRWRRLPFYINTLLPDPEQSEEQMTGDCMRTITQDFFKAVAENWDELLDASWDHVSILEDKIYENPADESRAGELWKNAAKWLVYEKLMYGHQDVVNDMRKYLAELDGDTGDEGQWLKDTPVDFVRLGALIDDDLAKRTNNLSELMYKSVGIRDSRESLRLGASMWRLSWITFIFLPLTFLVSFFGMNVDTFASNPSIAWYFITAVPFMILVLILWYALKHWFAKSRQQPLQRGAYEALFTSLQSRRPDIWTRQGPREYILPRGRASRWKWALIKRWTTGDAIPRAAGADTADDQPIGQWNRCKRYLIEKWTSEIRIEPRGKLGEVEAPDTQIVEALLPQARVAAAPALPVMTVHEDEEEAQSVDADPNRNSGVLVEERVDGTGWVGTGEEEGRLGVKGVDWAGKRGRSSEEEGERRGEE